MGKRSEAAFARATDILVGGVNSPARSFATVGGTPLFIEQGQGSRIFDLDNIQYIDCLGSWGSLILGHAHRYVVEAIKKAATRGASFGSPIVAEIELAEMIRDAMPALEMLRMVSSGTEATLGAIRVARAATGRKRILKFDGSEHGQVDSLLVKPGSSHAPGIPDSAGVPKELTNLTVSVPYNNLSAAEQALAQWKDKFAAVLVEPVGTHIGCVPPAPGFLEGLRAACDRTSTMLIFDETVTGFRVAWGGAQARYGVRPDLTILGRIIGGGLSMGAFGGSRELMKQLAPEGPVFQSGTLAGNPVAVAAGKSTLSVLKNNSVYRDLEERGAEFEKGVLRAAETHKVALRLNRVGSMWTIYFTSEPVTDLGSAKRASVEKFVRLFNLMLTEGVYLPPSPLRAAFFSSAHAGKDIQQIVERTDRALKKIAWEFGG